MDPAQNTVEDLMLRICYMETVDSDKGVCLYTMDGMPLTDDPFFNTCKLVKSSRDGTTGTDCRYFTMTLLSVVRTTFVSIGH